MHILFVLIHFELLQSDQYIELQGLLWDSTAHEDGDRRQMSSNLGSTLYHRVSAMQAIAPHNHGEVEAVSTIHLRLAGLCNMLIIR